MVNALFLLVLLLLSIPVGSHTTTSSSATSSRKKPKWCSAFLGAAVEARKKLKRDEKKLSRRQTSSPAAAFIGTHHTPFSSFRPTRPQNVYKKHALLPLYQHSKESSEAPSFPVDVPSSVVSSTSLPSLQKGTDEGLYVVDTYHVPWEGVDVSQAFLDTVQLHRLEITATNLTLPIALMIWDPERYPSLSRARKACRQGKIVLVSRSRQDVYDNHPSLHKAKVRDRIYPGDVIGRQDSKARILLRHLSSNANATNTSIVPTGIWEFVLQTTDMIRIKQPPFRLKVVYEDDYMALVNKPAGVLVYAEGGKGINNVRYAALHGLYCPTSLHVRDDTVLDRPEPVHRLDFVTSGLLVLGKTKKSLTQLAQQFEFRRAQKTYTAIVRGIPDQRSFVRMSNSKFYKLVQSQRLTHTQALERGFLTASGADSYDRCCDVSKEDNGKDECEWNLLHTIGGDGKNATTLWRVRETQRTIDHLGNAGFVSVVQLVPKTGRYHQLRRHMAWIYKTPIVGDPIYDMGDDDDDDTDVDNSPDDFSRHDETTTDAAVITNKKATKNSSGRGRYHRGLMLCANQIRLLHPYFNTVDGRKEWDKALTKTAASSKQEPKTAEEERIQERIAKGELYQSEQDGNVYVHVSIDLPEKFQKCLLMAEKRAKYNTSLDMSSS
eukprot:scaffold1803_cov92-Amphora_coffeaeformis.AAC.20